LGRCLASEIERLRALQMLTRGGMNQPDTQSTLEDVAWIGADGTRCRALLISGRVQGRLRIAGVALLADYDEVASSLSGLAAALAEQLARDGDAKGAVIV
jgi:hypothetical protein